jgi:hypothetical protein
MGALAISTRSEGEGKTERSQQYAQTKPEAAICAPALSYESRSNSTENPERDGQFHLISSAVSKTVAGF